jgi:hypothetical protein
MKETARNLQKKPLTETTLQKILPINALDMLIEGSGTCVSLTKQGSRCKNKLYGPVDELPDLFEGFARLNIPKDWNAIYPKLERIVQTSLCRTPHGRTAGVELLALDGRIIEWANNQVDETLEPFQLRSLDIIDGWFKALRGDCENSGVQITELRERLVQRAKAASEKASQNTVSEPTDGSTVAVASDSFKPSQPTTFDPRLAETDRIQYIQAFLPYQPYESKSLVLQQAIKRVLQKPITTTQELESKYLYIYWSPGNFGYVKIGVADDVPTRLRGWEEQCKHDVREHIQHASGERVVVKHAYRVEKLVHTELKEVRFQEKECKGCQGRHIEWFLTSSEHAAQVIRKYSDWMSTSPYQFDRQSSEWRLNEQMEGNKIEELCQPIAFQPSKSTRAPPARRVVPRRLSSAPNHTQSRYSSPG